MRQFPRNEYLLWKLPCEIYVIIKSMGVFTQSWCFLGIIWENSSECFYHNAIENVSMMGKITISLHFMFSSILCLVKEKYVSRKYIFIFVIMFVQQYAKTITARPKFAKHKINKRKSLPEFSQCLRCGNHCIK